VQGLKTLVKGHFQAIEYLKNRPQDAAKRMASRLNDNALGQFAGLRLPDVNENRDFLSGSAPRLRSTAQELANLMVSHNLLQRTVAVEHIADPSCLPEGRNE